ncbi:MAG: EAL domain-containing protein [Rhodoferax sp.]|nr:EAL domain-containing protein [Rhodoferax sp.]
MDATFHSSPVPRWSWAVAWLVGLFALAAGSAWVWSNEQGRQALAREQALHLAQSHAQVLHRNVERVLSANHALAALVWQSGGRLENFEQAASRLLVVDPRFLALSVSPGGVVRHVVPLAGNERLVGFDVLNDPGQGKDAQFARDTGRLTVAGPHPLQQGGFGVVSRLPVFLPGGLHGEPVFWGFTNVAVRLPDLMHGVALGDLERQGYHYELWRLEADTGRRITIASSSMGAMLDVPVRQSLEVASSAWNLDVAPAQGWLQRDMMLWRLALVTAVAVLLGYLARLLLVERAYKHGLEVQVAERTAEILATQNQLKSTLDAIRDPMFEADLDGLVHAYSAPGGNLLPELTESPVGKTLQQVLPAQAARVVMEALQKAHQQGHAQGDQIYLPIGADGRWFELSVARKEVAPGAAPRFVSVVRDITGHKQAKSDVRRLAFYDPLTELPNRRLLQDRLEHALTSAARSQHQGALLLIDLDNFKALNDTLGHDKGDLLLQQVAQRLRNSVRDCDTVARLGGDEFVVLVDDLGPSQQDAVTNATAVAQKIVTLLSQPYDIAGREHRSSTSVGVSLFGAHTGTLEETLKRSDVALYQAKAAGRNTLRFFDPAMQAEVEARAALEVDLRQALAQDALELHYQPQVGPSDDVVGAEALLRWTHPERGAVSPAEFIAVAEQSGLILDLGQWVLRTACAQLRRWADDPRTSGLTLAVNVSVHQFRQADFVARVLGALDAAGADAHRLKLEITESMLAQDLEDIIGKMVALKARGVGFSLDDFGTGYSSLSYLKRLPLDQLKIDQTFVRDVLTDPNDAAIARTIVALGQSLGLSVIAEGVETWGQRAFLASHGCTHCQGYLISRPLPAARFEDYLRNDPQQRLQA